MPASFTWKDFAAGWCPSDDQINGRLNSLPKMDNLELDRNGALSLSGGTIVLGSPYPHNAHTIYSNLVGGTRHDYVADDIGGVYRDDAGIISSGDTTIAAFSQAFDYTLIASGDQRMKDTGAALVALGIGKPTAAPTIAIGGTFSGTAINGGGYFQPTSIASAKGTNVYGSPITSETIAADDFQAIYNTDGMTGAPYDFNVLGNGTVVQAPADTDIFSLQLGMNIGDLSSILSLQFDILLVDPAGSSDQVSDYYTWSWENTGESGILKSFDIRRFEFTRVGSGNLDWSTVYGYRVTIIANADVTAYINTISGSFKAGYEGTYEYIQVNVNHNGAYEGKSESGPVSASTAIVQGYLTVTPQSPTAIDSQTNEVWIFRRGGTLKQYYRVLVIKTPWAVVDDLMTDVDAQVLGITFDPTILSVAHTSLPDKILAIIGPIEGRWYYFTTNTMYPSEINSPDSFVPALGVKTTGSTSEIFLSATRVSDSAVIIATSKDFYLLTGTFVTLPDGTIDSFYRSLSCKNPAISYDASFYSGQVFYLAADGWRTIDAEGGNKLLVAPNTDRLYRGITAYGYSVDTKVAAGTVRFPVVFGLNRLWCGIHGQSRIEVLDITRAYWRNFSINHGDLTAITATQDGQILGFFSGDKKLRRLDITSDLRIDGATNQDVLIWSPIFDAGTPKQRHEIYTIKARLQTGSAQNLTVKIVTDDGTIYTIGTMTSNGAISQQTLDVSQIMKIVNDPVLTRYWYYILSGSFSSFILEDVEIDYDVRPQQVTALRLLPNNFGNASKKRVRVWPHIIDSLGHNVVFTPDVDGAATATSTFNTTRKATQLHFFKTDVFGVDYGAFLLGDGLFEYFGDMSPDIVQVLPIARQFDQVGPEELFRYGTIKQFEIRVLPFGTAIPWTIYFNDNSVKTGSIPCLSGLEQSYFIGVPMGVGGSIVRIEFGPTTFNFHRFYVRMQVRKTGQDTDLQWVTLPANA